MGIGAAGALGVAWLASPERSQLLPGQAPPAAPGATHLNGWVTIGPDGDVTVAMSKMEMGQGIHTGLAMLVAEELEVPWERIQVRPAFEDPIYNNLAMAGQLANALDPRQEGRVLRPAADHVLRKLLRDVPGLAVTGASTGMRDQWHALRAAGASARLMLVQAAAAQWGVPASACRTEAGEVVHPSGQRLGYGALAEAAARRPVPRDPPLKPPQAFKLIGRPLPRLDAAAKSSGRAVYGLDVRPPGLLYAAVRMAPVLGGRVKAFDARQARALGALAVVVLPPQPGGLGSVGHSSGAVAVVADKPHRA